IRDFHVTGVQTCALPISAACGKSSGAPADGTGGDTSTGGDGSGGEPWVAPSCSVSPYHFRRVERPEEWHTESSECPPGPLFTLVGRACEGSWDFCDYRGRRYTGYTTLSINSARISCDSRISIGHTTICCDEHDLDPC